MCLFNSPLCEVKPEVAEQIFSMARVCNDVRDTEEQNILHVSS